MDLKIIYPECPKHKKYREGRLGFDDPIVMKENCHLCLDYKLSCGYYQKFLAKRNKKNKVKKKPEEIPASYLL
ncbi:MAG: hypothetical protein IB618_01265 [Candidatus Pacearchaeota archaeon]|nr:MAG: hypothetical protein IB618_01265 [Candidatus Pacearchaeota archaeon]